MVSVAALAACLALGAYVTHFAGLTRVDAEASALRGTGVPYAAVFTLTGRAVPVLVSALAGIAFAYYARIGWRVAVAIFDTQLFAQGIAEILKYHFMRARPDAWLVHKENGFSFPSGHATTAIVFFGSWAVWVACSPLRNDVKIALTAFLALWALGIDWSRIALGAHYPTDVAGGTLLGVACSCAMWAVLLRLSLA